MRSRRIAALAVVSVVLAACEQPSTSIAAELIPETTELHTGATDAIVPLADGRLLVDDDTGLWIVSEPGTAEPERVGEPGELGAIVASTELSGATLIAGEDAVVLVRGSTLGAAPVTMALGAGESIVALVTTPRRGSEPELWIASTEGLYVFRDDVLRPIELEGHDLAGAAIARAGEGAVWAIADERLLRIAIDDDMIAASLDLQLASVTSLASDDRGVPYVVAGGVLHVLEADRTALAFPIGTATAVRASGIGPDVWAETDDGVFHVERRVARPVQMSGETLVPGIDGEAFVRGATVVERIRARHRLAIEGLHDGAGLVDRTSITIATSAPDPEIDARVDGVALEPAEDGSYVLDPTEIAIGDHVLEIAARWDDGTLPVTARARFSIAPSVTWSMHVQAIYAEHCSDCHGPAGPSPTRLDSREAWQTHIVRILDNTRTGRMPLGRPPLDPGVVELIDTWSRTGFPE